MNLLLDTHLLLWAAEGRHRLPARAADLMADPGNALFFSSASIWEVAIKQSLNRPDFDADAMVLRQGLLLNGYQELAISGVHAIHVRTLPPIHKDLFDRILVAQAQVENQELLTADRTVARYPGPVRLV